MGLRINDDTKESIERDIMADSSEKTNSPSPSSNPTVPPQTQEHIGMPSASAAAVDHGQSSMYGDDQLVAHGAPAQSQDGAVPSYQLPTTATSTATQRANAATIGFEGHFPRITALSPQQAATQTIMTASPTSPRYMNGGRSTFGAISNNLQGRPASSAQLSGSWCSARSDSSADSLDMNYDGPISSQDRSSGRIGRTSAAAAVEQYRVPHRGSRTSSPGTRMSENLSRFGSSNLILRDLKGQTSIEQPTYSSEVEMSDSDK